MTKRHTVMPEAMGRRSELDHALYGSGQEAYDLFSVSIAIGSGNKRHVVNAPRGGDPESRRLRRYALALSRFALPMASITKRAKVALRLRPQTVKSAIRAMAQATYRHSFSDDATIGTVNTALVASPLVDVMKGKSTDVDAVVTALSLSGTQAFNDIVRHLAAQATEPKDTDFLAYMGRYGEETRQHYLGKYDIAQYERINRAKGTWERRAGIRAYDMLAKHLERKASHLVSVARRPKPSNDRQPGDQRPDRERHDRVVHEEQSKGWVPFRLSKPDLTVSHTGKLGRKVIRGQEGKYPHYIDRLVTDPERRIFRRKTRSLGAVVVLDCSGSMGWSESDIDRLIQSCSGATILAYSSGDDDDKPNAWVVARRNQRMRKLPDFPGGNGVDGPALRYAVEKLRISSVNPVIWVSDQRVTGLGDVPTRELRAETDAIVKRHRIYVTEDLRQTLRLVARLQGK